MADEAVVKSAWAIDWSDVATAEATFLERCAAGGASHMDLPDCHQPSAQSPTLALGAQIGRLFEDMHLIWAV